jgi:hypothetical protein
MEPSVRCARSPLDQGRKKVRTGATDWVGDGLPCRGQEAPQRALRSVSISSRPVVNVQLIGGKTYAVSNVSFASLDSARSPTGQIDE